MSWYQCDQEKPGYFTELEWWAYKRALECDAPLPMGPGSGDLGFIFGPITGLPQMVPAATVVAQTILSGSVVGQGAVQTQVDLRDTPNPASSSTMIGKAPYIEQRNDGVWQMVTKGSIYVARHLQEAQAMLKQELKKWLTVQTQAGVVNVVPAASAPPPRSNPPTNINSSEGDSMDLGSILGGLTDIANTVTAIRTATSTGGAVAVPVMNPASPGTIAALQTQPAFLGGLLGTDKHRHRRKRLATVSDIKDLAALKAVLGSGEAFKTWIATHSR